ncbi:MAG: NACHT domain-containing protein, partial [Myxococcales bacterium]|nr:NACHT domain-containing protein [Myxococcales bacterium]
MSTTPTPPWWQTSLKITAVVVALAAVAIWAPWPINALAVLGAVVFLLLSLRNPDHWLRRAATGCLTGAAVSGVVPDLAGRLEWQGGFVEITKDGMVAYALLATGVAMAALDVWRERARAGASASSRDARGSGDDELEPPDEPIRSEPKDPLDDDLRAYFTAAVERHRTIELAGFEARVRAPIRLQDLYVPLHAMFDRDPWRDDVAFPNAEAAKDHVDARGMRCELLLSDALEHALRLGRSGVVLLGDPGSGKTTHLRRILLKIAHDGAESLGLPQGVVPVFLPLRNLEELDKGLDTFIERELAGPFRTVPEGFGERLRVRGRVLYLLDGLDEVRSAEDRAKVASWIDQARTAYHDSYFMVTCRYAGYTGGARLSENFLEVHLRPLDDEQVDDFVRRWFSIVETSLVEAHERPVAMRRAKARADELVAELRKPEFQEAARVYELTHNPLLLTTICLVHRDSRRLPDRRVDLYDQCVNVLLERWNDAKKLPITFPAKQARALLQPVARWMHDEEGRTRATTQQLVGPLREALEVTGLTVEPGAFLASIRDESGLLTGWGVDEFGFMHLGLQEFLTAQQYRNEGLLDNKAFDRLAGYFGDSWWQEVILLMLAQRNPPVFEPFMRALTKRSELASWADAEMMDLSFNETAVKSAAPFVEVILKSEAGLGKQQVGAAKVLRRKMPEEFARLEVVLAEHLTAEVRMWWAS